MAENISRTLYNWMMDPKYPQITAIVAKQLVDSGKVGKDKVKRELIPLSQFETWGVIDSI